MRLAFRGVAHREVTRSVTSCACLAFVAVLAVAFWTGALWISHVMAQMIQAGW